jgi:lipid-A-disaccharide synthase
MSATERRLGILAGGGGLPREIADSAAARGLPVAIVAIDGEADADFGSHPVTVVNWGQIGAMVRALKAARATDLVIVGRVHRPELKGLKPDVGLFRYLPQIVRIVAAGGDDSVLRRVVRFFERQGLHVIGPGEAAPELLIGDGPLGDGRPSPDDRTDIARGFALVRALGAYDIGQSVIVSDGRVEAIEGAEGTDRMIARAAGRRSAARTQPRGVLVKRSKPGQDLRVDMPAIGPATVDAARAAGLAGIAVEAGKVLVADRDSTLRRANAEHLFIEGVDDGTADNTGRRFDPRSQPMRFRALGHVTPGAHALDDAIKAVAVIDALAPFEAGRAAVVVRNHVLSVEAGGEGVDATLTRAAGLRQWASLTHRRRGIAGVRTASDATPAVVAAVASAGYAGIAIRDARAGEGALAQAAEAADAKGLCLLVTEDAAPRNAARLPSAVTNDVRLFLVAGEHSGDALGAKLVAALKKRLGARLKLAGVGGADMEREGFASDFPMSDVAVMGPLAILRRLPRIVRRVHATVESAVRFDPHAVVIIDSPEFTHPIARRIRKRRPDIPIVDYVSPSVWAWRPGRARKMRPYVDHILGILPFEPETHVRLGGPPCTYVGHSLIERLDGMRALDPEPLRTRLGLDPGKPVVVVLPGSRASEVGRLLEPFGDTLRLLIERSTEPEVIVPCVSHVRALVERGCRAWPLPVHIVEGDEDKVRAFKLASAALAASGTVTLELALAGTPMVVAYRVDPLAAPFLRRMIKARTTVLANLVLGENAFPEFHQEQSTPEALAAALRPLLSETPERRAQLAALARIPDLMHIESGSPSEAAADIVLDYALRGKGRAD